MYDKSKQNDFAMKYIRAIFKEMNMPGLLPLFDQKAMDSIITKIYVEHGLYITKSQQEKDSNQDERIDKTCPFCLSVISNRERIVFCRSCNIPYHADCWKDNNGCAVFGCYQKESTSNPKVLNLDNGVLDLTNEFLNQETIGSRRITDDQNNRTISISQLADHSGSPSDPLIGVKAGVYAVIVVLAIVLFFAIIAQS